MRIRTMVWLAVVVLFTGTVAVRAGDPRHADVKIKLADWLPKVNAPAGGKLVTPTPTPRDGENVGKTETVTGGAEAALGTPPEDAEVSGAARVRRPAPVEARDIARADLHIRDPFIVPDPGPKPTTCIRRRA